MQKDFVRDFFTASHKILMDLDGFISTDNILYTEKNLNDLEKLVRKFRKQIKAAFTALIKGKEVQEQMKSDVL